MNQSPAAPVPVPPLVVHVIYALGTGGLENGLVNLINRSPPGRYRHAIICLTRAEAFAARIIVPGVKIVELNKRPGHDPGMYWRLWRVLRRLRPDIVHSRNLAALETQVLGLLMPGCRRVHGEHGRDVSDLQGLNPRYRRLRRWLAPLIHRFIAVSRDLTNWLVHDVGLPATKVTQIYNGVEHDRFAGPVAVGKGAGAASSPAGMPQDFLSPGVRVVGTVGRLAAVKDQVTLVRALAHILADRPTCRGTLRSILVGEGPERGALEQAIAEAGLEDVVWLAGDREDIPALLARMDIFVLPSLGEGISNTILEAMAAGLPVVATRVGGNPELVIPGETGDLVSPGDARALAGVLQGLLDDPDRAARLGEAGRARVRRDFDWEHTVASYLRVYDEVLHRQHEQGQ